VLFPENDRYGTVSMVYVSLGLIVAFIFGYLLTFALSKSILQWERVGLSPAVGFGGIALLLFFLWAFKLLITETQLVALLAGLCLILLLVYRDELLLIINRGSAHGSSTRVSSYILWNIVLLLFGLSLLFSSFYPIFITDGNNYEATGRLIALNRGIDQKYFFRSYAPFVPLLYSFIYFLGGTHPTVIFSIFYFSLIGLFYFTMMRETQDQRLTIIFTGIIASTPFLWWHSYLGLLNFTAGYFFSIGCFYLISFLVNQEDGEKLFIAGVGFGLAAFTRLECLVYFFAPFLLLIYRGVKGEKLLTFSIPALIPATLWGVYERASSQAEGGIYTTEEVLVIVLFWVVVILSSVGKYMSLMRLGVAWCVKGKKLLFCVLLLFGIFTGVAIVQSKIIFLLHLSTLSVVLRTGACVVFRLLAGNLFWMFTTSLLVLLVFKSFRETFESNGIITTSFLITAYCLLHIFIHTYHVFAHDPSGVHPYHRSLVANLKWVFFTPGSFFNTSEVRDLLAINPLVMLLFGQICCSGDITKKSKKLLSYFLWSIILLNIITLSVVFLWPRLSFLYEYRNASLREMLLSPGPNDNPNMEHLRKIYKLMYFIKDHTEEESTVYFVKPHFSQAEAYKILLPRGVKFIDGGQGEKLLKVDQRLYEGTSYLAFKKENVPELAKGRKIEWNDEGWGICKVW